MITNEERSAYGATALLNYAIDKEGGEELYDEPRTVIIDLLTDLMHYAHANDIDFVDAVRMAEIHFEDEYNEGNVNA